MQTKYDVGEEVLVKGVIRQINVNADSTVKYTVSVESFDRIADLIFKEDDTDLMKSERSN